MITLWLVCAIINLILMPFIFRRDKFVYGHILLYVAAVLVSPLMTITIVLSGLAWLALSNEASEFLDRPVFKDEK